MLDDSERRRKCLKPVPTIEIVDNVLRKIWSLEIQKNSLRKLESYDDCNFYFQEAETVVGGSRSFLLKFYNGVDSERPTILYAYESFLGKIVAAKNQFIAVSKIVSSSMQSSLEFVEPCPVNDGDDCRIAVRLFEWIHGDTLNKVGYTPSLACAVGSSLGNLTLALSTFEEPAFHRTHGWDLKNFDMNVQFFSFVEDLEIRSLIVEVHEKFCLDVKRDADLFPVSIIQGDCNDANVIVAPSVNSIAGIIDFGDATHTWTVNEIAIAICYALLSAYGLTNPAECISCVLGGFCVFRKLLDVELLHLRTLIATRLCISVSVGAYSISRDPSNEYLKLHSVPGRSALAKFWRFDRIVLLEFFKRINDVATRVDHSAVLAAGDNIGHELAAIFGPLAAEFTLGGE